MTVYNTKSQAPTIKWDVFPSLNFPFNILHVSQMYEPFVCDLRRSTLEQGTAKFSPYMENLYCAIKTLPNTLLHLLVQKKNELSNIGIFTVIIVDPYGNALYGKDNFTITIPRNTTKDGKPVVVSRSNSITSILIHEKSKRVYISGDFKYDILGNLPPDQNQLGVIDYDDNYITDSYENILCVDYDGFIIQSFRSPSNGGVSLDSGALVMKGYDQINRKFFDKDDGSILIGGSFSGFLKKITPDGKEITSFNPSFLNGAVRTIEIDWTTNPTVSVKDDDNIDIYIGGDFTVIGSPNNNYITRIKNATGTLKIMELTTGLDIDLNDRVNCIKLLRYHNDFNNKILMVGGKFTSLGATTITKVVKFIRQETGINLGKFQVVENYRPIYDDDTETSVNCIEEYNQSTWDYILLGGKFTNAGQKVPNVNNFCRVSISDGTLDLSFSSNGYGDPFGKVQDGIGFNGPVNYVKIFDFLITNGTTNQPTMRDGDSKIFVGGAFTTYGKNSYNYYLVRLINDRTYKSTESFEYEYKYAAISKPIQEGSTSTASTDSEKTFDEVPEGVVDVEDQFGKKVKRALSTTSIEVLDLLSEGEIEGLVNGEYIFEGNPYEIGYTKATFIPYQNAPKTNINWFRSIYWNEVPLVSSDNKYNYQSIDVSFTPGLPNGAILNYINPKATISRTIGERLRATQFNELGLPILEADHVKTYRILNPECTAAFINIRIQTLQKTVSAENGDLIDALMTYYIYFRPIYSNALNNPKNFTLAKKVQFTGKIQYGFIKTDKISFYGKDPTVNNRDFLGWEIKIARRSPDSLTSLERNTIYVDSITEIYEDIHTNPNSAIVRSRFNSEYFSQIPNRFFDTRLIKVKIPSNYDPILKRYNESTPWDGSFKENKYWTDNPAWCFYDIITNENYGLGKYIDSTYVDKWSLYEISKYCDVLVPDGYGGWEPRFACNIILNNKEEAYKVINNMASIFRGLVYFGNGVISATQDSPKDPITTFTNSNIKDGNFGYASSSRRVRHTVAIVRYNDKRNFYKPAIEYVEDVDGIRKYGIREIEIDAIGCTSRGQALRFGRAVLLTENLETETISFNAGLEASYLKPGDVINVIDNNKKLYRYAGRIKDFELESISNKAIIKLDSIPIINTGVNYVLNLITPTYNYNATAISDMNSSEISNIRRGLIQSGIFNATPTNCINKDSYLQLEFNPNPFDIENYEITKNTVWSIHMNSGDRTYDATSKFLDPYQDQYRIINIEEKENELNVIGLQYNAQKYIEIESGINFDRNSLLPQTIPSKPTYGYTTVDNVSISSKKVSLNWTKDNNSVNNTHTAIFISPSGDKIDHNFVPDNKYLVGFLSPEISNYDYSFENTGDFIYSLWGYNYINNTYSNDSITGFFNIPQIFPILDVVISSLNINTGQFYPTGLYDGIVGASKTNIDRFYELSPVFTWQMGSTGEQLPTNFNFRLSIREPSYTNTPSSTIYFEYTGIPIYSNEISKSFDFKDNVLASGGPFRKYDVVVEAVDNFGRTSAGNYLDLSTGYHEPWTNPYGYDLLYINNERITGLALSTGINKIVSGYITRHFIDCGLNINITYVSGTMPKDIIGGYIYFSTGLFSGENITGNNPIPSQFNIYTGYSNYNSYTKSFQTPIPYEDRYFSPTGYICFSVIDSFDMEIINNYNSMLRTGFPLSNITSINFSGVTNTMKIGQQLIFTNFNDNNNIWKLSTAQIDGRRTLTNSFGDDSESVIISSQT